jgi:hypothetical protein
LFQIPMTDPNGQYVITAARKAADGNVRVGASCSLSPALI